MRGDIVFWRVVCFGRVMGSSCLSVHNLVQIKRRGFSDAQVAKAVGAWLLCVTMGQSCRYLCAVDPVQIKRRGFSVPQTAKAVCGPPRCIPSSLL